MANHHSIRPELRRRHLPGAQRRLRPAWRLLESLETRRVLTPFTVTSPTRYGALPSGATPVGGIVLDLVGMSGRRVVSQLPASELFTGLFRNGEPEEYRGNPGTIGVQEGMSGAIIDALGGGILEASVRLTIEDGDTARGDFDYGQNVFRLSGVDFGNFSDVVTEETSSDGARTLSTNPGGGFRDRKLDTGFFYLDDPDLLARLFEEIVSTGEVRYQLYDDDPYDNVFDFTQGLDGGLSEIGQPPVVVNVPPVIVSITAQSPISVGGTSAIDVVAQDPDGAADPLTYLFDFDNDGTFDLSNTTGHAVATFTQPGVHTIGITVRDSAGDEATGTTTVEVRDNPPRLTPPADQNAPEGVAHTYSLGMLADDAGDGPWTVTVTWGDGSASESFGIDGTGALPSRSHVFAQDGDFTVTLLVRDRLGATDTAHFLARVASVPPVVDPPANQSAGEGASTQFTLGSFRDQAGDGPWTVGVNWGDGSATETFQVLATGPLPDRVHRYAAHGAYTVRLTVTDDFGASNSGTFDVSVANVAPALTVAGDQSANEGASRLFALGSFADQASDGPWSVAVDWGDGSAAETFQVLATGALPERVHRYAAHGTYAVTLTVTDDAGVSDSGTFDVSVANVPPALTVAGEQAANEGTSTLFALGSFADQASDGPWSVAVDWGDRSATETFQVLATGALPGRVHRYAAHGTYAVTLTVTDDAGVSDSGTFDVSVANVPPALVAASDQSANEGTSTLFALGSFADQASDGPWSLAVDWGDGSARETFQVLATGALPGRVHRYAAHGTYAVTLTLTDDAGVSDSGTFDVSVANVPPVLTVAGDQFANEGASTLFALGAFADQPSDGPWSVAVDWGDGSATETFQVLATGAIPARFHGYAAHGSYTVTITVTDDVGVSDSDTFDVSVANVPPALTVAGDQSANEGASTLFALGAFADQPSDGPWSVAVDWGDGSATETFEVGATGVLPARAHTYLRDGTFEVLLTIRDNVSVAGSARFRALVENVAPSVFPPSEQSALEGSTQYFALGRFLDPGRDAPWAIVVDWGDGTARDSFHSDAAGDIGAVAHTYAQDGVYFASVAVFDGSASTVGQFVVRVANQAPSVTLPRNQAAVEGAEQFFDLGSFFDQDVDAPWAIAVDWGDGSPVENMLAPSPGAISPLAHTYAQDGDYAVTYTIRDADALVTSAFLVHVENVAPALVPPVTQAAREGVPSVFDLGRFDDPGAEGVWTLTVNWGDGTAEEEYTIDVPGQLPALSHTFDQDGVYEVEVRVADGAATTSATFVSEVANVAPVLLVPTTPLEADEGSTLILSSLGLVDSGREGSWSLVVDWGDGTPTETTLVDAAGTLDAPAHRYAQDGAYSIELSVSDDDETVVTSLSASIHNVAPSIVDFAIEGLVEVGKGLHLSGRILDPGVLDRFRVKLEWLDDGADAETLTGLVDLFAHELSVGEKPGVRQLRVTVEDEQGGQTSQIISITVAPAPQAPPTAVAGAGGVLLQTPDFSGARQNTGPGDGSPDSGPDPGTLVPATPPPADAESMSLTEEKKNKDEEPEEESEDETADKEEPAKPVETPIIAVIPAPEVPGPPKPAPKPDADAQAPAPAAPPVAVAQGVPSATTLNMLQNNGGLLSRTTTTRTSAGGATTTAVMVVSAVQVRRMHARRAQALNASSSRGGRV